MTEHGQEEGVVPAGAFDFATDGFGIGMGLEDVEGEPSQNREVLGSIVLSRAVAILVEMDVEYPMELVLDAPVTPYQIGMRPTYEVGVAIVHDDSRSSGYRVLTAYPRNYNPLIGR